MFLGFSVLKQTDSLMKASDDVWLLNERVSPELLSWSLVFKENAKIPVQVTGHLARGPLGWIHPSDTGAHCPQTFLLSWCSCRSEFTAFYVLVRETIMTPA